MAETEIIQDDSAKLQLLEEIKNSRLPVQVMILEGDFTGMTHVNGIRQKRNTSYFRTASVEAYIGAIGKKKNWRSRFEFYGKDSIQYSFQTTGWKSGRDGIWHRLPDIIERKQRRKFFRLEIPFHKDLFLTMDSGKYKMTAIDISLGGIFVEFFASSEKGKKKPSWEVGDHFENLMLEANFDAASARIHITKGILRRCEREPSSETYKYAFEFSEMSKPEESALVDMVYDLQRKILKERIKINA